MTRRRDETIVLCIGNPLRGDDALGPLAAPRLRGTLGPAARVIDGNIDGADLATICADAGTLVIIDIMVSGMAPGTIARFDATDAPLPAVLSTDSTHLLGVAQGVELARTLGTLPDRLVVYAVEGSSFEHGAPLSDPVSASLDELVERVVAEVRAPAARTSR